MTAAVTGPKIDPATIVTPDALAAALDQLRHQCQIRSKRAITTLANKRGVWLPKSTVDDLLSGRRVPNAETLRAFLTVCGVTDDEQVQAWLRAAERARRGDTDRPAGAIRVQAANPRLLGVRAAIQVPGATGELPAYVLRDLDQEDQDPDGVRAKLRTAAVQGGFVLLFGGSSVGKTRCAYEALQAVVPDWWLVYPDPDQPEAIAALAADPPARTVIWLDELQTYLDRDQGLTAATVRTVLHADEPIVLIGTLWPHWYTTWTTPPSPGQPDPSGRQREVLNLAEAVHVPAEFSPAERDRANQLAATDAQLQAALALGNSGYGLTQILAAVPQLVARWEGAGVYAKAVLAAAVDATRLGVHSPLSLVLLRAAAPGYCTPAQQALAPPNWFETALAYATELLHGAASALIPVGIGMGELAGYTVTDYLLQYATVQRRYERIPATTWDALLAHIHDRGDLMRLADNADARLLYCYAVPLYRRAADSGDVWAAEYLAMLLAEQGRVEELRARADSGDEEAAMRLAKLLAEQGRVEELRARADSGDEEAAMRLAKLLAERGYVEELRARADSGDVWAIMRLVELLVEQGRVEEAIVILRSRADSGDEAAAMRLAELLAERGYVEELRARADAGDEEAIDQLSELLVEQGRVEEAIVILRSRADSGDYLRRFPEHDSARHLAGLLMELGRVEEATVVLRSRAEAGDGWCAVQLSELLAGQGRVEEAIVILRPLADTGDQLAALQLEELLVMQGVFEDVDARASDHNKWATVRAAEALLKGGRAAEGIMILRSRADSGDEAAAMRLADLLAEQGHIEELRTRADADDWEAAARLADLLAEQGHIEELRTRANSGDRKAAARLAELLVKGGRAGEAIVILRSRADSGDWEAAARLAELLVEQGHIEELRARADSGDEQAAMQLVEVLAEQGSAEEAIEILRLHVGVDDTWAVSRLVGVLTELGRVEEAIAILRSRADADTGGWEATNWLIALLVEQGHINDLRAEVDAGRQGAAQSLIHLLEQEYPVQATQIRKFGFNPNGSILEVTQSPPTLWGRSGT